jgi:uridylate kinase
METVVISLGGSLIVPSEIDVEFLKKFKQLIISHIKNKKFIIICGGGKTARIYQSAASKIEKITNEDLDWLGIHATRLNGHLLRTIFREHAHSKMITNPEEDIEFNEPLLIAAGYKPGCSTDYDAILLAKKFGVKTLINLTNTDYVYTKDPKKFKDAKPWKNMTWKEYRKISGDKWDPGLNVPFDPVAAKEAEKIKAKVVLMNGKNIENLDNFLKGKNFKGTIIDG